MTPTEELDAYLGSSRDGKQQFLQRVGRNVAVAHGQTSHHHLAGLPKPRSPPKAHPSHPTKPEHTSASTFPPGTRATAPPAAVLKRNKAALLHKLKLAQQQQRTVAAGIRSQPETQVETIAGQGSVHGRLQASRSKQRAVSFKLPPPAHIYESETGSLPLSYGICLPSPPPRQSRSALKVKLEIHSQTNP